MNLRFLPKSLQRQSIQKKWRLGLLGGFLTLLVSCQAVVVGQVVQNFDSAVECPMMMEQLRRQQAVKAQPCNAQERLEVPRFLEPIEPRRTISLQMPVPNPRPTVG